MPLVEIKDFNALIDNKPSFGRPVKNKHEAYEKLVEMSRNNNGTTINDTEDLNLVMPMYNLIEYSSDYSETTKSLWFYSKDQAINFKNNIQNTL